MGPGTKGYVAMIRDFCGLTDEQRREFRSRVLKITPQSLRQVAGAHLRTHMMSSVLAAYAAEDRLKRANEQISQKLQIQNLM
jgi:Zn-dependent M16 (insulinase) family peptidase